MPPGLVEAVVVGPAAVPAPAAEERERAGARTAIVRRYHDGMVDLLQLLGIEVPTRM